MNPETLRRITAGAPWNLFLLAVSAFISSYALVCIAKPHGFVSGGLYGTAMLIEYDSGTLSLAIWYALLNIPVLAAGWRFLSRRFMLYTIYCIALTTLFTQFMPFPDAGISDRTLAAVATGVLCGAGSGIALRSLGSDGGLNIISLILNMKYGMRVGTLSIIYNVLLFLVALRIIGVDNVLYSMVITYLTSSLMNYFMGLFNERKMVLIISDRYREIGESILRNLGRGCTVLHGEGAYTRTPREVVLTVVHNIQLRRLEELVYGEDPHAFVIIENTHQVLGKGFSTRRTY